MNFDDLVAWGRNALGYLDDPRDVGGRPVDLDVLRTKLGWLADCRDPLAEWDQVMATISATLHYVRHEGYHRGAARDLRPLLAPHARTPMSRRMAAALLRFVRSQSALARNGERLIGSSECLESLLGKGKRLEGQQSKSGFTKMLLGLAAAVVRPTREYLEEAFARVKTEDVANWCRDHLGISLQAQRRQAFAAAGTNRG